MRRPVRAVPVALLALSAASLLLVPRGGETLPLYAARTGLECQTCHFDPNGGGPRNEFGFAFAKNRHRIEPEGENSPWKDLNLANRVADNVPVYFGLNHRMMLLADRMKKDGGFDRLGFYNMEDALFLTFQPHEKLALVYSRDGFNEGASTKEAFGLLTLPAGLYLKAGQFRPPFGLRMDDHTVATRVGFAEAYSNFFSPKQFLPYNPRGTDRGVEVGGSHGGVFSRIAWTNGGADPIFGVENTVSQTFTGKLGANMSHYQGAISFYDDFHFESDFLGSPTPQGVRTSRWSYYGMTHVGPVAVLGEVAAGTDREQTGDPAAPMREVNKLAYFAEADWSPSRPWNFRLRFDHLELNRTGNDALRDLDTYDRVALEGEVVPVPFAEVRWVLRAVNPKADRDPFSGDEIKNEKQAYLQLHFSY